MNCIFCQIVKREKPAKVYYEDENIIVFADILPKATTHLLFCTRVHFVNLKDVPQELLLKLFDRIKKTAEELKIEDNYRLLLNNGPKSGQIIPHVHFHFMSNEPDVRLKFIER